MGLTQGIHWRAQRKFWMRGQRKFNNVWKSTLSLKDWQLGSANCCIDVQVYKVEREPSNGCIIAVLLATSTFEWWILENISWVSIQGKVAESILFICRGTNCYLTRGIREAYCWIVKSLSSHMHCSPACAWSLLSGLLFIISQFFFWVFQVNLLISLHVYGEMFIRFGGCKKIVYRKGTNRTIMFMCYRLTVLLFDLENVYLRKYMVV